VLCVEPGQQLDLQCYKCHFHGQQNQAASHGLNKVLLMGTQCRWGGGSAIRVDHSGLTQHGIAADEKKVMTALKDRLSCW
jgi:hypothetical protein